MDLIQVFTYELYSPLLSTYTRIIFLYLFELSLNLQLCSFSNFNTLCKTVFLFYIGNGKLCKLTSAD